MSGATVSINKKWDDGTLVQIGGVGFDDFHTNLIAFVGIETADEMVKKVGQSVVPASAGRAPATPAQVVANAFPGAAQQQQAQQPAATGGEQFCPSHQRPVIVREKKDGSGSFAKCPVNDTIVSNYGKPGLREYCPKPKQ